MANEKKYKALVDRLVESGAVHAKGQVLMVPVSEERATALINAGFIEEVVEEKKVEEKKVEEKVAVVPENKMETGAENKGMTGKGADLINKKKKK